MEEFHKIKRSLDYSNRALGQQRNSYSPYKERPLPMRKTKGGIQGLKLAHRPSMRETQSKLLRRTYLNSDEEKMLSKMHQINARVVSPVR